MTFQMFQKLAPENQLKVLQGLNIFFWKCEVPVSDPLMQMFDNCYACNLMRYRCLFCSDMIQRGSARHASPKTLVPWDPTCPACTAGNEPKRCPACHQHALERAAVHIESQCKVLLENDNECLDNTTKGSYWFDNWIEQGSMQKGLTCE